MTPTAEESVDLTCPTCGRGTLRGYAGAAGPLKCDTCGRRHDRAEVHRRVAIESAQRECRDAIAAVRARLAAIDTTPEEPFMLAAVIDATDPTTLPDDDPRLHPER